MTDYTALVDKIYGIKKQSFFSKSFFIDYIAAIDSKAVDLNEKELLIPNELINLRQIELPVKNITIQNNDVHRFNESISYIIKVHIGVEKINKNDSTDSVEFKHERKMSGIHTRKEFEEKYPDTKLPIKKGEYEFIPSTSITYNDFCVMINNYPECSLILNPFLIQTNYSPNISNSLQRIEMTVKRKVMLEDIFGKKIITKFSITCKCGQSMILYPNDIHTAIKHECGFQEVNGVEKVIRTTLDKSGLCPVSETGLWIYECKVNSATNPMHEDTVYFYSMNDNLLPGKYIVDIWNAYVWDMDDKGYVFYPIILGFEKKKIEIKADLIKDNHPMALKYCEDNALPYAKFLDVLFSWRDICHDYTGRTIDNRGMLVQLMVESSALAKQLFSYDKLGVNVMGNKSLSKTYPTYLSGILYDLDFQHIGSSQDISLAGLRGGVNTGKIINGKTARVFEKGVFGTAGLTLFDEGEKFFEDHDMNMTLKTYLDEKVSIKKIGGGDMEQIYTPLIMSNFPYKFSQYYAKEIRDTYKRLITLNSEKREHGNSDEEIAAYLSDINLYLPLGRYEEDYKNQTLAKSIGLVRYILEKKELDWRTGGSMPSSYRLLLDTVCWNSEEFVFDDADRQIAETESVLPSSAMVPSIEFIETLKSKVKYKNIDLKFEIKNSKEEQLKLKELSDSIDDWFKYDNEGRKLFLHLSGGKRKIDEKLNSLVYKFIKTLQCYEDLVLYGELQGSYTANIKKWVFLILSKCKRGVSKAEYDFEEHYDNIIPKNEKFSMLEAEIEKIKSLEQEQTIERVIEKKLEAKNNDMSITQESLLNKY